MKNTLHLASIFIVLTLGLAAEPEVRGSIKVEKKTSLQDLAALVKISATEVLAIATKEVSGRVVELELEVDDGALISEVTLVTDQHSIVELKIDAGTGEILEKESDD
jgi:uncharacterized membrane protein YkoI